jgi:hypothetical protein
VEEGDEMKVKRIHLIAWSKGVIMDRDGKGNVFAVDEVSCMEAEQAIENGEIVELMDSDYNVVSTMSMVDGKIVERKVTR